MSQKQIKKTSKAVSVLLIVLFTVLGAACAWAEGIKISLAQAIEQALEKNRSVIVSKNSININQLNLDSARSNFDLTISPSAGAGVNDRDQELTAGIRMSRKTTQGVDISFSPTAGLGENYTSRVGVSLGVPLLKGWGKLINMDPVMGAEYSLRSAGRSLHKTRTDIIIQTVTRFYTIVEYKERVEMNNLLLNKFKSHATLAKLKSDIGLAGPLDVYRAEIKVKDAQADLTNALEAFQNGKNELKSILSIPQDQPIDVVYPPIEIEAVVLDVWEAERIALENSIDILHIKDSFDEAERNSKIARQNKLPDLRLSMDYSRGSGAETFENAFSMDEEKWRVFLTSTTDFGRTKEKISYRQSLIDLGSAKINIAETKDKVRKEVRTQLGNLVKTEELISITKEQIHQTTGKKELAEIKFNNDMANNFDLIEAETELHQARLSFLNARINYIIGTYQLRKIMGTLLEYEKG